MAAYFIMTYEFVSKRTIRKTITIKNVENTFQLLKRYAKSRQEQFIEMTLNGSNEVIAIHLVTLGLVNKTIVHPREVFIHAISDNASAIIIAHNHPSGKLEPSHEDIEVTQRLKQAGEILGILLLDHLIITKKGFYSFRAENKLD